MADETAALRQWAESGDGDAPTRDTEASAKLVAAVENADRVYGAAVAARAVVEPSVARARAELLSVEIQLDYRAAHAIAAEGLREVDELI